MNPKVMKLEDAKINSVILLHGKKEKSSSKKHGRAN